MRDKATQAQQHIRSDRNLNDGTRERRNGANGMTSRGTKYWNSGAIPLIAPEILGDIIAQVADMGVVISDTGEVLSVLANPASDAFRSLERWDGWGDPASGA